MSKTEINTLSITHFKCMHFVKQIKQRIKKEFYIDHLPIEQELNPRKLFFQHV